jgi:hypothetical protein
MKINLVSSWIIKLTSESSEDIFVLGRLSVKLDARVNTERNEQREMECALKDLIKLAAK